MSDTMAQQRTPGGRARRVNAPVRRARPSGSLPDVLMAAAFGGWAMAIILGVGSFFSNAIIAGEAGPGLARIFAASVTFAALLTFLLGIAMLRETQWISLRIAFAFVVGALGGSVETLLLLNRPGWWMVPPLLLIVLVVRPVRERILIGLGFLPRGDGR